jgi:hypothetical protein
MIIKKRNKHNLLCYWDDIANASKVKSRLEKCEQIDLNHFCAKLFPIQYEMMWHTVGEGKRDAFYGAMLKRRGKKDGVPDWLVMIPVNGKPGLFLELKRSRKTDSSIPKGEREFLLNAEKWGYVCVIAYGYKPALQAIEDYLNK